jgi:ADP-heptose:LPS heptosyltransferase
MNRLAGISLRSIAVFRALQLGDLLCAVPALRALRAAAPGARIVLIGLPWAREFARRFSRYLDGFLEFPGHPALPEITPRMDAFPRFIARAQREHFDLAIQMHGSGSVVNTIMPLLGAQTLAGFCTPRDYCPDPLRFMPYPGGIPEIRRLSRLVAFLGVPVGSDELEFPLTPDDRRAAAPLMTRYGLRPRHYACIHPGARLLSRRWRPEYFAAVGDAVASRGLTPVLTGSAGEQDLARRIGRLMKTRPVDLTGRTGLGPLAVVLGSARLLISNDTGVSHIAAALKVPSVIIVTGSDPARWAPLDRRLHRTAVHRVPCRPCAYTVCPSGQPCAGRLAPATVIAAAAELLASTRSTQRGYSCVH